MAQAHQKPRHDIATLRKRSDFVAARTGTHASGAHCRVQIVAGPAPDSARLGLTVTKKNGNAVQRNRIKRRLRAAVAALPAGMPEPGTDCVILARPSVLDASFDSLKQDVATAIAKATRRHRRAAEPQHQPNRTS